jgi:hypothetical protein
VKSRALQVLPGVLEGTLPVAPWTYWEHPLTSPVPVAPTGTDDVIRVSSAQIQVQSEF